MALSVALMWLPSAVAMRFVSDPGPPIEYITHYCSYISRLPIGYGNWFPIIIAILAFTVLLMLIASVRRTARGRDSKKPVLICLSICVITSPLSWLIFGGAYEITIVGVIVFALHVVTLALQYIFKRAGAMDVSPAS